MLTLLDEQVELCLVEAEHGWALLLSFPSDVFEYDARTYGHACRIAVLDGTIEPAQFALLERLPHTNLVIKTHDARVARYAIGALDARSVTAFVSFTAHDWNAMNESIAASAGEAGPGFSSSPHLNDEMRDSFARSGYGAAELERYFASGAHWFAIHREGGVAAACFVFQNFEAVWEIAGVHAAARHRRQGLAARIVRAAVQHLLNRGLVPRYQTEVSNLASVALARRIGLVEFLRIEHLMVERRMPRSLLLA
jgi:GNAT superfamily N-acetyltransferase